MADLLELIMENPEGVARQHKQDRNYYKTIQKMLESPSPEVRIQALKSVSVLKTRGVPKLLLKDSTLKEIDDSVRKQLGKTYKKIGDLVLEPLIEKLQDDNLGTHVQQVIDAIGYDEFKECLNGVKIVSPEKALYYEIILKIYHPNMINWSYSCFDPKLKYETTFQHSVDDTVDVLARAFRSNDERIKYNALLACNSYPQVGKHLEKYIVSATRDNDEEIVKQALETLVAVDVPSTVPVITKLLHDDNPEVRMDAARLLGEVGGSDAIGSLIDRMEREKDGEVLQSVQMALGEIGEPAAPYLVEKLRQEQNLDSIEVALKRIGPPAVKHISEAMTDPNRAIRANATKLSILIYTSEYGFGGTVVKLIELLKDKSDDVREAVIESILNMGDPAIEYVFQALGNMDERIRDASVDILDRFSYMNIEMALNEVRQNKKPARAAELGLNLAVQHPDVDLKDLGYGMLIDVFEDKDADWEAITIKLKEVLRAWLQDPDPDIRFSAVQVAKLFGTTFLPELHEIAKKDKETDVWEAAIESLGEIGKPAGKAVPDIVNRLGGFFRSADQAAKITIYTALGSIGTSNVLPHLIKGLNEDDEEIRGAVVNSLKQLGDTAYGALINALQNKHDLIRQNALNILLGADTSVLPPLLQFMHINNSNFQSAATKIIMNFKEHAGPILVDGLKTHETEAQANIMKNLALLKYEESIPEIIEAIRYGDSAIYQSAANYLQIFGETALARFVELFNFSDPQTLQNIYEISLLIDSDELLLQMIEQLPKCQGPGLNTLRQVIQKKRGEVENCLGHLKGKNPARAERLIENLVTDPELVQLGEQVAKV